ncbi:MAG: hypothetical protein ACF8XB_08345 [Planctomycetota bacterium JB042]
MNLSRTLLAPLAVGALVILAIAPAAVARDPSPLLLLELSDSADPVAAGGAVTYTATVTNQGAVAAQNLEVYCGFPAGQVRVVGQRGASTAEWLGENDGTDVHRFLLPSLSPGASAEWALTVETTGPGAIWMKCAVVAAGLSEAVEQLETTDVEASPAADGPFLLDVTQDPESVAVGGLVTYRVSLTLQGEEPQTNVSLRCVVPVGHLAFEDARGSRAPEMEGAGTLLFLHPMLQPGTTADHTVVVRAERPGEARVSFWLDSDGMAGPVERAGTTTVLAGDVGEGAGGRVRLFLGQEDPRPQPGERVRVDLTVLNADARRHEGMELLCWLDPSMFVLEDVTGPSPVHDGGDGALRIEVPPLDEKAEATWVLGLRLLGSGEIRTVAELRSPALPTMPVANLTTHVGVEPPAGEAILRISEDADPVGPGEIVTYSIEVTHQGFEPVTDVLVRCDLDFERLDPVGEEGPTRSEAVGFGRFLLELPELRPGQSATWRMKARALAPGEGWIRARLFTGPSGGGPTSVETTRIGS